MQENLAYIEDEHQEFVIDNPQAANWAVMRIKEDRARRDLFIEAAKGQIELLNQQIADAERKCDQSTSYLLFKLDDYLSTAPAKKAKTQLSLELPAGKLVRKFSSIDYKRDNDRLAAVLQDTEYVDNKPVLKWAELKKDIQVVDGSVIVMHHAKHNYSVSP